MFETSQDILYVTVSACIALFTVFLVWIMYYIAQISRQSNEMISDFRQKMEELNDSVEELKDKMSAATSQIGTILEFIRSFTGGRSKRKK